MSRHVHDKEEKGVLRRKKQYKRSRISTDFIGKYIYDRWGGYGFKLKYKTVYKRYSDYMSLIARRNIQWRSKYKSYELPHVHAKKILYLKQLLGVGPVHVKHVANIGENWNDLYAGFAPRFIHNRQPIRVRKDEKLRVARAPMTPLANAQLLDILAAWRQVTNAPEDAPVAEVYGEMALAVVDEISAGKTWTGSLVWRKRSARRNYRDKVNDRWRGSGSSQAPSNLHDAWWKGRQSHKWIDSASWIPTAEWKTYSPAQRREVFKQRKLQQLLKVAVQQKEVSNKKI